MIPTIRHSGKGNMETERRSVVSRACGGPCGLKEGDEQVECRGMLGTCH